MEGKANGLRVSETKLDEKLEKVLARKPDYIKLKSNLRFCELILRRMSQGTRVFRVKVYKHRYWRCGEDVFHKVIRSFLSKYMTLKNSRNIFVYLPRNKLEKFFHKLGN